MEPESTSSRKSGSPLFETTVKVRDLFLILAVLGGGLAAYYSSQSQMGKMEARVDSMEKQNLPPRVSALEAQSKDTRDGMRMLHQDLVHLGDLVAKK